MILKQDRPLGTMRPVMGQRTVRHGADQGRVVVHDDAVVEHRCVLPRQQRRSYTNPKRERGIRCVSLAGASG